jgi:hypothetical protein
VKSENYEIAKALKKRLSKDVPLTDFRFLGSKAQEIDDEYPDMDVFIEVKYLNNELKKKISDIVWDFGYEHLIVISYVIFAKEEIENNPSRESPIVKKIYG